MEQLDLGYVKLMLINLSLAGLTVPCNARFGLQASRQSHSELGNFQCKTSRSRWPASSSASAKIFFAAACASLAGFVELWPVAGPHCSPVGLQANASCGPESVLQI